MKRLGRMMNRTEITPFQRELVNRTIVGGGFRVSLHPTDAYPRYVGWCEKWVETFLTHGHRLLSC